MSFPWTMSEVVIGKKYAATLLESLSVQAARYNRAAYGQWQNWSYPDSFAEVSRLLAA